LRRRRALAWQEAALRLALLGGLATSALQVAVCGGPLVSWGAAAAMFAAPPAAEPFGAPAAPAPEPPLPAAVAPAFPAGLLLLAVAAAGAAFGCAWLLAARAHLRAVLRGRRPETDGRVLAAAVAAADTIGLELLPRLSRATALGSPVTFGLLRAEVCLPGRVDELGAAELRALFCHEFAHIGRGDAGWLWLGALLQALFPWQIWLWPLRRRLSAVAELRCDAAASRCTSPVAVAQCLVQVASWLGARRAHGRRRPAAFGSTNVERRT